VNLAEKRAPPAAGSLGVQVGKEEEEQHEHMRNGDAGKNIIRRTFLFRR
jgi:hypothetical protein